MQREWGTRKALSDDRTREGRPALPPLRRRIRMRRHGVGLKIDLLVSVLPEHRRGLRL